MSNINKLKDIMKQLRDPNGGCPWDVEQDFKSISPHTIEEAYEVVDAIDRNDMTSLKEELGDLLLQVIFHSQMAEEKELFSFEDVVETINKKLIDRHPHVFSDKEINTAQEQEQSWEELKSKERELKNKDATILDDIAITLPALTRSIKIQKRVSKVGFDWQHIDQIFDKITEELDELKQAIDENSNIEEEYGDLLFAVSSLATKLKLDPEVSLKLCNKKFIKRFNYIEKKLSEENQQPSKENIQKMEELWNEAKKLAN